LVTLCADEVMLTTGADESWACTVTAAVQLRVASYTVTVSNDAVPTAATSALNCTASVEADLSDSGHTVE
jgi:hypothetical protein